MSLAGYFNIFQWTHAQTQYIWYTSHIKMLYVYKSLNIRTVQSVYIYIYVTFFCIRCYVELRPEHGTWKWMGFRCRKSTDNSGESKLAGCLHIYTSNFICCIYLFLYVETYLHTQCTRSIDHSQSTKRPPQNFSWSSRPKSSLLVAARQDFLCKLSFGAQKNTSMTCLDESMVWWNGWTIFSWPKGSE